MTTANFHRIQAKDLSQVVVTDPNHAPIVFVDGALVFGHQQGVIHVTCAATRTLFNKGKADTDYIATAFLRMSTAAAIELRDAIDHALLIATPPDGGKQ